MVNDFMVVCVDTIISSAKASCFDSVNGSEILLTSGVYDEDDHHHHHHHRISVDNAMSCLKSNQNGVNGEGCCSKTTAIIRECRICQEEDEEHDLEVPCACNGTLKFAHRKCIQRWCDKKGNITCEICSQVFSPNYTLPPARSIPDTVSIDIRHSWGPHIDLRDPHYLAFSTSEHQFLESDYEDYAIANSGSLACFRFVVIMWMVLLLIRQVLMVTKDFGMVEESSRIIHFQISLVQLVGFLLPCYAIARSWYFICRRRRQG